MMTSETLRDNVAFLDDELLHQTNAQIIAYPLLPQSVYQHA